MGQVRPPIHFRRSVERQPAVHIINGWFVTSSRMFQREEGCAVLLPNAIGRGREGSPRRLALSVVLPSSPPPPKHYRPHPYACHFQRVSYSLIFASGQTD